MVNTFRKKGYTLAEVLIVMAILSIGLSLAAYWFYRFKQVRTIENDVNTVYMALKHAQTVAKSTGQGATIEVSGKTLEITYDNGTTETYTLHIDFSANNKFYVNPLGVFTSQGSIYTTADGYRSAAQSCVKVSNLRICEGRWDGKSCNCNI
jgi:prepilin-type N-terminal cleavage/methylation domain-containing protein